MKNSKQKPTLFDILAWLLVGFITLYSLAKIFSTDNLDLAASIFGNEGLVIPRYVCIFALSLLVGLLITRVSNHAFDGFMRNKHEDLKAAREKLHDVLKRRNEGKKIDIDNGRDVKEEEIDEDYERRCRVASKYGNSVIPILEAQISFIRTMFFVILLGCVAVCRHSCILCLQPFCAIAILLALDVIAAFYMFSAQKKIYFHVYEDSYYMNELEKEKKDGGETEQAKKRQTSIKRNNN